MLKLRTRLTDISRGGNRLCRGVSGFHFPGPPPPCPHGSKDGGTVRTLLLKLARLGERGPGPGPGLQPHLSSVSASFSFPSSPCPSLGPMFLHHLRGHPAAPELVGDRQPGGPDGNLSWLQLSAPGNRISCAQGLGPHRASRLPRLTFVGRGSSPERGHRSLPRALLCRQGSVCDTPAMADCPPRMLRAPGGLRGGHANDAPSTLPLTLHPPPLPTTCSPPESADPHFHWLTETLKLCVMFGPPLRPGL